MLVLSNPLQPEGPAARIPLGNDRFALVDPDWFDFLNQFHWYAKKSGFRYYACRKVTENGKTWFVRMHRIVADTPPDLVCHHVNGRTFDNRRNNLLNMSGYDHAKMHSYR